MNTAAEFGNTASVAGSDREPAVAASSVHFGQRQRRVQRANDRRAMRTKRRILRRRHAGTAASSSAEVGKRHRTPILMVSLLLIIIFAVGLYLYSQASECRMRCSIDKFTAASETVPG